VFPALLSDDDLAAILGMTINWIRSHARDIPGFKRLGPTTASADRQSSNGSAALILSSMRRRFQSC
jgi:hypothetical protein